jgi:hypothetical protein
MNGGETTGCGLSIATSSGHHFSCALGPNHDGDCVPRIDSIPRPRLPMPCVCELSEAAFLGHLLNMLEAALPSPIGGPLFTREEAIKLCRSLIWQRLGRETPF